MTNLNPINYVELNRLLLADAEGLLKSWLPNGKADGKEYRIGDIYGSTGSSLSINMQSGIWTDFADPQFKGGDLISLYAAIKNIKNSQALKELAELYNLDTIYSGKGEYKTSKNTRSEPIVMPDKPSYDFIPCPQDELPPFTGKPSNIWTYKNEKKQTLFFILRYDKPNGSKSFTPWSYTKTGKWVNKAYLEPRPLYNMHKLKDNPSAPILITEGEKACDAAEKLLGSMYICVTWPGGANAWKKADFYPLKGRKILIWPDNDEAGISCAYSVAKELEALCDEIKILNPLKSKQKLSKGYDAYDALASGLDKKAVISWAKEIVTVNIESLLDKPKAKAPTTKNLDPVVEKSGLTTEKIDNLEALYNTYQKSNNGSVIISDINTMAAINYIAPNKIFFDEFYNDVLIANENNLLESYDYFPFGHDLLCKIQEECGLIRINKTMVNDAIIATAYKNIVNEPKDWLLSLKWDGQSRITSFFPTYMKVDDNEYSRAVSSNFWVSMVARVLHPGCKVDNMVILESKLQGRYKSSALKAIGGKYYAEITGDLNTKDFYQQLEGKILLEIGELDAFGKADSTRIKQIVSSATDRYRSPYDRKPKDKKRTSIFVGTTNDIHYLKDTTGNRRFWPLYVNDNIDIEAIERDRDQLFAEAVHLYNIGTKWHIVPESAKDEQDSRSQEDALVDLVDYYLIGKTETTVGDIILNCLENKNGFHSTYVQRQVSKALTFLGWHRGLRKNSKRPWYPPTRDKFGNTIADLLS